MSLHFAELLIVYLKIPQLFYFTKGNHPSAGSTTPIHLQLIDMYNKKSKDIRLKKKDMEGHHFAPGAVDEFKMTLLEPLSTLKAVQLSLDADKYQGWYGEWISIIDDDNQVNFLCLMCTILCLILSVRKLIVFLFNVG